jgi:ubiquinone/menaquinone biosynthesis C-methylase UbiE
MADQYASIAPLYDDLAALPGVREFYAEWRRALLEAARTNGVVIRTLVDLACGTGNTAIPWAERRGWTVVGVDASAAMLRVARRKSRAVRWSHQDLSRFRMDRRADAVTCHGDALNHLLDARHLARAFRTAAALLEDGGVFLFDLNTAAFMRWVNGRQTMFRAGRNLCIASNAFDQARGIATFHHTWFVANGRMFAKREVTVRERAYADSDVRRMLRAAGFKVASVTTQRKIDGQPSRLLYTAVARPRTARRVRPR